MAATTIAPVPLPPTRLPVPTQTAIVTIGKSGSIALYVGCLIFLLSAISLAIHSTFVHRRSRVFHMITVLLAAISALSYYAMATGSSGRMLVPVRFEHRHPEFGPGHYNLLTLREVFYGHFIQAFFTTPLILLNPMLLAGVSWIDIFTVLLLDEMMVFCVFMGGTTIGARRANAWVSLRRLTWTKWGWFGFSILFFVWISYTLLFRTRRAAAKQPKHITSLYDLIIVLNFVFILTYAVLYGLGDVSNRITVDTQVIAFTALDAALGIVVPATLIFGYHAKADEVGHGPNALPDHLYEDRDSGWHGRVRLPLPGE